MSNYKAIRDVIQPQWAGNYRTHPGTISKTGTPVTPGRYRARLHDQATGAPLREVWSSTSGAYSFDRIAPGTYYVTAFDHTGQYGGVIETDIVAEPMP